MRNLLTRNYTETSRR